MEHEPDMNVISVLQRIAAQAETADGKQRRAGRLGLQLPGRSLRRLHDGHQRPRAAGLLGPGRSSCCEDHPERNRAAADEQVPGRSRPVRRSPAAVPRAGEGAKPGFRSTATTTWAPARGSRRKQQEQAYPLSECMSCGCCLEACPQYVKIELERREGETDEQFEARENAASTT